MVDNKIKILFVIENLNPGGAERVFTNLINSFDPFLFKIKLITINDGRGDFAYRLNDNIERESLKKDKKIALFALARKIKAENPDIVFSTLAPINILCVISKFLIFQKNIRFVIRETTIKSISIKNTKKNLLTRYLYTLLVKILYRFADSIISLSEGAKKDLVENFGVKNENITVIYNPLDIAEIVERSKEIVDDTDFDRNCLNLICLGTLTKSKGFEYLIEATDRLHNIHKLNVHTHIIGKGKFFDYLNELCIKLNIIDRVHFLGFKSNPYKYIKKCDIFVHPAIWEGFGNVIVEAMACGIPVVSTTCESGPKEIIQNNINGILVPPRNSEQLSDKIMQLYIDKAKQSKLIENAERRSYDFDIGKISAQYQEYMINLVKEE